jgi:hypothetical protein
MYNKFYMAMVALILSTYAYCGFSGYEVGTRQRQFVPADVRHAAGGYRSFHFWHSGYQGGK